MGTRSAVHRPGCCCDNPRHLEDMLSIADAAAIARSMICAVRETELVGLGKAAGRVVARDINAPRPMPFFDQSAMDGFAVRTVDLAGRGPWRLALAETVAAGDRRTADPWAAGSARRIFTGAPVPAGADAVVMLEDCKDEDGFVTFDHVPCPGENIRRRGSDIARGALLVAAGTRLEPRHVGLLAANGYTALNVFRRPRVGVFSTGSELVSLETPEDGQIFDANRPMLVALAENCGAEVTDLGIVDDNPAATVRFFARHAGEFDLLLSSGAVSAGGRDFIRPAFVEAGGKVHAWKVALKPGKPVLFGTLGGTVYLGLPGNPLSAFVGFELFGREQILRLGGVRDPGGRETRALADFSARRKPGRTEFVPARIASWTSEGLPVVETLGNGSSGTLHALGQADGLAVIAADKAQVLPGDPLGFLAFCPQVSGFSYGELP